MADALGVREVTSQCLAIRDANSRGKVETTVLKRALEIQAEPLRLIQEVLKGLNQTGSKVNLRA